MGTMFENKCDTLFQNVLMDLNQIEPDGTEEFRSIHRTTERLISFQKTTLMFKSNKSSKKEGATSTHIQWKRIPMHSFFTASLILKIVEWD